MPRITGAFTGENGIRCPFGSGKETALLPPPPLRTGRESFPSSGSSRCEAPRERSRFSRRFNPGFMAMDSEFLEERTFRKISVPVWIERIGFRPDFNVPPDFGVSGINQLQPNGFTLRCSLSGVRRKRPLARADGMEVTIRHP